MSGQDSIDPSSLRSVIEDFLDELSDTVSDTHTVERVLSGAETLTIADLNNQPEEWTEGNLIWPLIEAVGLNREPGRPASQRSVAGTTQREAPDFRLVERDGDLVVIGENKSPNQLTVAEEELVGDYLSNKAWPDYGIATDGFEWVVYRAEHGGDFLEFNEVERVDLRPAINAVARDLGRLLGERGHTVVCGGRGGTMEAVCRGAREHDAETIGVLPGERLSQANDWVTTPVATGLGNARNVMVPLNGAGVVAVDGAAGTLSELGHALDVERPVAGLDTHAVDLAGFRAVSTPAEAVDYVESAARSQK